MKSRLFVILVLGIVGLAACTNQPATTRHKTKHEHLDKKVDRSGKEYTSKYICPMHCNGSGSDTTGVCPDCGMDYVPNKK